MGVTQQSWCPFETLSQWKRAEAVRQKSVTLHAGLASEKQGARTAKPFTEVAYGYLPLVWGITLAHYLLPFLGEAGNILPVCLRAEHPLMYINSILIVILRKTSGREQSALGSVQCVYYSACIEFEDNFVRYIQAANVCFKDAIASHAIKAVNVSVVCGSSFSGCLMLSHFSTDDFPRTVGSRCVLVIETHS